MSAELSDFGSQSEGILPVLYEKCRSAKHNSRLIHEFFKELVQVEETYGKAMRLLTGKYLKEMQDEGTTLKHAWTQLISQMTTRSDFHIKFSETLTNEICPVFHDMGERFKKEKVDEMFKSPDISSKELKKN